jgi:hypothetical protein
MFDGPSLSVIHVVASDRSNPKQTNQPNQHQVKREPGKPVLNLDFLLQTVVQRVIPLDWPK